MTENSDQRIRVEVAYALPEKQKILAFEVPVGTTARQAVAQSGIETHFDDLDITTVPMGIFGQALGTKGVPAPEEYQLSAGDRIELYRPLIADPKALRKQRAEKAKEKRG